MFHQIIERVSESEKKNDNGVESLLFFIIYTRHLWFSRLWVKGAYDSSLSVKGAHDSWAYDSCAYELIIHVILLQVNWNQYESWDEFQNLRLCYPRINHDFMGVVPAVESWFHR